MAEPYDTLLQVQEHDTAARPAASPTRGDARAGRHSPGSVPRQAALAAAVAEVQAQVDDLAGRQAELEERIAVVGHASARRSRSACARAR